MHVAFVTPEQVVCCDASAAKHTMQATPPAMPASKPAFKPSTTFRSFPRKTCRRQATGLSTGHAGLCIGGQQSVACKSIKPTAACRRMNPLCSAWQACSSADCTALPRHHRCSYPSWVTWRSGTACLCGVASATSGTVFLTPRSTLYSLARYCNSAAQFPWSFSQHCAVTSTHNFQGQPH